MVLDVSGWLETSIKAGAVAYVSFANGGFRVVYQKHFMLDASIKADHEVNGRAFEGTAQQYRMKAPREIFSEQLNAYAAAFGLDRRNDDFLEVVRERLPGSQFDVAAANAFVLWIEMNTQWTDPEDEFWLVVLAYIRWSEI